MAGLEISINCLCLFVDDARGGADGKGIMHVLMPDTSGSHHEHHVNVLFDGVRPNGKRMEGLALRLGGSEKSADLSFEPREATKHGEEIVDLNDLTGATVDRDLLDDKQHPKVISRLELHDGRIRSLRAEARWHFQKLGARVAMANEVVWEIDDIADDQFEWTETRPGSADPQPFTSLGQLAARRGGTRRLELYNVTTFPPPRVGTLNALDIKHHFEAFYDLYGVKPTPDQLPDDPDRIVGQAEIVRQLRSAGQYHNDPHAIEQLAQIAERVARAAASGGSIDINGILETDTLNCPTAGGHPPKP